MASPAAVAAASDLFNEALAITHSYGDAISQQQRILAEGYLMDLRQSADGLNLAFHIVSNEPVNDIRCFWAFNTIMHHLPQISPSLDGAQSMQIYATLSSWFVRNTKQGSVQDFLLNKHAQLMVAGVQEFFPHRWQSFFADLLQMFHSRDTAPPQARDQWTLYFLRIFEYIDERVVCVRAQGDRSRELRQRDMLVKDAMREHVISAATNAWYALLIEYRTKSSDMMKVCLTVIASYIEWIDIHLMISAEWLNLFYHLTTVPIVRQGSVECLVNLVAKKQLTPVKVETLTTMNLVGALPRIVETLSMPSSEEEEGFLLDVVFLTVSTASELLQCCQAQGEQGAAEAQVMLHVVLPEIVKTFSIPMVQVVEVALPFVQQYIKSQLVTEAEAAEFLHVIYRHTVLPDDVLLLPPDEFIELRKTLHNMLRLILRKFPAMVQQHCKQVAGAVMAIQDVQLLPAAEAEAALRYVYELGESFRMDLLKDTSNDVAQIVNSILCGETLPSHPHSAVHLAYFEVLDRYHPFFIHHRAQVPVVLGRFLLQPCGIANSNAKVRSRICYLFGHLLQVLKVQFAPHAEHIVGAMKAVFQSTTFSPGDKFDLYEGLGTLLSVSDLTVSSSVADTIVRNLQDARRMGPSATEAITTAVSDDITFLSQFAKGIGGSEVLRMPDSPPLVPRDSSPQGSSGSGGPQFPPTTFLPGDGSTATVENHVVYVFCAVTREVMLTHEHFQSVPLVRERVCLYMHQMVNILPFSGISEFFESFVLRSLRSIQAVNELPKVLRVVYQFVNKTRGASIAIMANLIPPMIARVQQVGEVTQVRAELGVVSEQTKELLEVLKTYFSVIHAVAHSSALPCLVQEPALQCFPKVLGDLVDAAKVSAEFELPKQAFQILSRLCFQWVGQASGEANPSAWFESFFIEQALPAILDVIANVAQFGNWNMHDAKIFFLVGELCQMLKTVVQKSPDRGFCGVFAAFTSILLLPQSEAYELCNKLREDSRASAQFKSEFRTMLEHAQQVRQGATGTAVAGAGGS